MEKRIVFPYLVDTCESDKCSECGLPAINVYLAGYNPETKSCITFIACSDICAAMVMSDLLAAQSGDKQNINTIH